MAGVTVLTPEKTRAKTLFWIVVHASIALLLLAFWLVVSQVLLRAASLESKYGFAPREAPLRGFQSVYALATTQFALWTLVLICAAVWLAREQPTPRRLRAMRAARWLLCSLALALVSVQVLAWTKSAHYASALEAKRGAVGAAFNDLFCETRALQVCTQEDELDKLLLVIGGDQSGTNTTGTSTTTTAAADRSKASTLAIWLRCRDLLVQNHGRMSSQQLKLLADCNPSASTDAWCGDHYISEVSGGSSGDAGASGSPFGANPTIFESLANEWPTRYTRDTMLLAPVVLLTFALSWCLKALNRDGDDGFELIDMKSGQRANAGSTPRSVA